MSSKVNTPTTTEVERWLKSLGWKVDQITVLPGDVSLRRYFRVDTGDCKAIAAFYPPELRAAQHRFQISTALLDSAGVRVPQILATDSSHGLDLLEDLGNWTLYEYLKQSHSDRATQASGIAPPSLPGPGQEDRDLCDFLAAAIEIAGRVRSIRATSVPTFSRLDPALLRRELERTWEIFLKPKGLIGNEGQAATLRDRLDELCIDSRSRQLVATHRDFMARNLIVTDDRELGVIDHQDLQLGPPTYDLASLLNDSIYTPMATAERLLPKDADTESYHRSAAQRCLKIVGTFVGFAANGSDRYLPQVPVALDRFLSHFAEVRGNRSLAGELRSRWAEPLTLPSL